MSTIVAIIGRICIAAFFILPGIGKLTDSAGWARYIEAQAGLGSLTMPLGVFELVAGLILAVGLMTRLTSAVLVAYVVLITLLFHGEVSDPAQAIAALKNLAIIGGLLMVFAYGQVRGSLSTWRERDRRHDAEVKAARAEGKAEGATARTVDRDRDGHPG